MPGEERNSQPSINELFPPGSRVLLTGGGKQFIERIGVEAAREVVLNVMLGENIRKQTEPLTRQRVAQVSGALVALFANGFLNMDTFGDQISDMAVRQIGASKKSDNASIWPAQWLDRTDRKVRPERVEE